MIEQTRTQMMPVWYWEKKGKEEKREKKESVAFGAQYISNRYHGENETKWREEREREIKKISSRKCHL